LHEEILLEPALLESRACRLTRSVAVTPEYSLPAPVRRPNTDERRACQADPRDLVYSSGAVDLHQSFAAALFIGLPPWLRDHPALLDPIENCCIAQ
jgi:hypothetical protein